jgi:hypothetical protein
MANEAGDKKLLGNFRILIDFVSADSNYNPANAKLVKTQLELQYTAAQAAAEGLLAERGPYKLAVTDCQVGYDELAPKFTRSFNMLKASGPPTGVVDDARSYKLKIDGARKSTKTKAKAGADPANPGDGGGGDESKTHSASQTSRENLLGHASAFLAIIRNVASYNPNEPDLKVPALEAFIAGLEAKSNTVNTAFVAVAQSRSLRDGLLYTNEDSVVNIALLVKAYVKAAFGTQSPLFKQIKGLKFVRQARD